MVNGDLTDHRLIELSGQLPSINEIWHIAGSTDFQEDKRVITTSINVDGTKNIVNLAKMALVSKLYYVSTAYFSGINKGLVNEDEPCEYETLMLNRDSRQTTLTIDF